MSLGILSECGCNLEIETVSCLRNIPPFSPGPERRTRRSIGPRSRPEITQLDNTANPGEQDMSTTTVSRKDLAKTNLADMVDTTAIRPFQVNVSETELSDLGRRVNATRWPEQETVTDASQGVQLATIQALANYWATEYDWRKIEAKLNALPQFITEIDGLDIHFIHVRSKQ
jgi:hypothetical protein